MKNMGRQGDVLIVKVDEFPSNLPEMKKVPELVLAEGEVTGHYHRLRGESMAAVMEKTGDIFFETEKALSVTHDEHDTIDLPAGKYKKVQQKEYSPEAYRDVRD